MRSWQYAKGHGTLNDFVVITDRHGLLNAAEDDVRFVCDRRSGIGADGFIRAVKASALPGWDGDPNLWFMDYRNADGTIAEMCGNGLRVFARYLVEENLASGPHLEIATRAGLRRATIHNGMISVTMGAATIADQDVTVCLGEATWQGTAVDVGNPHVVCLLGEGDELDALSLALPPTWEPAEAFPAGVNVEFVEQVGPRHIRMRVFERGVGETLSCGTGTVAAAAAVAAVAGERGTWRVDVRGGTLQVGLDDDEVTLTGPAVLVARGSITVDGSARAAHEQTAAHTIRC